MVTGIPSFMITGKKGENPLLTLLLQIVTLKGWQVHFCVKEDIKGLERLERKLI